MIDVNTAEEKIEFIDYLHSNYLLTDNNYKIALYIQKAYRKQKHFKSSPTYGNVRVQGGQPVDNFEYIIIANREWNQICLQLDNETINVLDRFVGREVITKDIMNDKNFDKIIYDTTEALELATYKLRKDLNLKFTHTEKILLLKTLFEYYTYSRVSKETGISRSSLYRIVNTDDYQYNKLKTILNYFDLND